MNTIRLHDLRFKTFIPAHVIQQRIKEMADEMNHDLKHERPLFVGILNGAFMFAAELLKELDFECELTFVKLSSYSGTKTDGNVRTHIGLNNEIRGRNVIILEDIIDTGTTVHELIKILKDQSPDSIRIAALLFKPDALEQDLEIDYLGFKVPNEFLVGYGLDYDGLGRNLKNIYVRY